MIELLLQAERALGVGLVDQAERLYRQAADADPRNSIAVVGLARVALERADEPEAWRLARRALEIDPENVAAQRLAGRLEEVWAYRGASLPEAAGERVPPAVDATGTRLEATPGPGPTAAATTSDGPPPADAPAVRATPADPSPASSGPGSASPGPSPASRPSGPSAAPSGPSPAPHPAGPPTPSRPATSRRSVVDRLLRRKRP